jgi:hypothetical protein
VELRTSAVVAEAEVVSMVAVVEAAVVDSTAAVAAAEAIAERTQVCPVLAPSARAGFLFLQLV